MASWWANLWGKDQKSTGGPTPGGTQAPGPSRGLFGWARDFFGGWRGPRDAQATEAGQQLERPVAHSGPANIILPWFPPYIDMGYTGETAQHKRAYRLMLADPNVKAALYNKILSVGALDLQIQPAKKKRPLDLEVADFVRWNLTRRLAGGVPGLAWSVLSGGLTDGYSVNEKRMGYQDRGEHAGKWALRQLRALDVDNDVVLQTDSFRNIVGLLGIRYNSGVIYPPARFLIFRNLPLYDHPTGQSELRAAYRPWWLLTTATNLRGIAVEKRATGYLVGTFKHPSTRAALENLLASAKSSNWASVPEGDKIEVLNLALEGDAIFKSACDDWREEIFLGIQHATLQALTGGQGEHRGSSKVHASQADTARWALCSALEALLNDEDTGLIRDLVDLNYSGIDEYPTANFAAVEPDEMKVELDIDTGLLAMGLDLSKEELYDKFGRTPPETPQDTLKGKAAGEGAALPVPGGGMPPGGTGANGNGNGGGNGNGNGHGRPPFGGDRPLPPGGNGRGHAPPAPKAKPAPAPARFAEDAAGHQHKGKGPGGGQFTRKGGGGEGGGGKKPAKKPVAEKPAAPADSANVKFLRSLHAGDFLRHGRILKRACRGGGAECAESVMEYNRVAKERGVAPLEPKAAPAAVPPHPGSAHGSAVTVKPTTERAFTGAPVATKTTLSKQETGRVGEAVVLAYLKSQGLADARPMNTGKTNFPIDLIEDHAPTEVKAGLVSNSRKAQQWRLTFSKETPAEKAWYEKATPEERRAWNAEKQKRIRERKEAVIKALEKETGKKVKPRTITAVINPDTRTADLYVFDGFHDRIDWQSDLAKKSYKGSVKYDEAVASRVTGFAEEPGGHWVTLSTKDKEGEKHGSTHVFINGNTGRIAKGPGHMIGKAPHELSKTHEVKAVHGGEMPPKNPKEPEHDKRPERGPGSGGGIGQTAKPGREVAPAPAQPGDAGADRGGNPDREPAHPGAARTVPASRHEVNRRLDRFEKLFRDKGQHQAAEWMGALRAHVNAVGTDEALKALGEEGGKGKGKAENVTYDYNWANFGDFAESYLDRFGITVNQQAGAADPNKRLIGASTPADEGLRARRQGEFSPADPGWGVDKLKEAKALPGLESSEDLGVIMGKEHGAPVSHLSKQVLDKLDERFGAGKWIVKPYEETAFAGHGIFFPQYAAQTQQNAKSALWASGQHLANYGFSHLRDEAGKVVGIKHRGGDEYRFGTEKYDKTIQGDARHWGDQAAAAAPDEHGAKLPGRVMEDGRYVEGKFMAQPAFPVVGISDAERAAGVTIKKGAEARTHIVTRNGKAELVPHATWMKHDHLPVVFETEDTKAIAQAAVDAINALPESERQGQIYAPDIIKTAEGYKVIEANPAAKGGASGWLGDNPFITDAYVSHLVGREPAHVQFIRKLLSSRGVTHARAAGG